jgi:hypothetical protein
MLRNFLLSSIAEVPLVTLPKSDIFRVRSESVTSTFSSHPSVLIFVPPRAHHSQIKLRPCRNRHIRTGGPCSINNMRLEAHQSRLYMSLFKAQIFETILYSAVIEFATGKLRYNCRCRDLQKIHQASKSRKTEDTVRCLMTC